MLLFVFDGPIFSPPAGALKGGAIGFAGGFVQDVLKYGLKEIECEEDC